MCSGPDCGCHSSSHVALHELTLLCNRLGILDLNPLCSHLASKLHTVRLQHPSKYIPEICDTFSHVTVRDKSKVTRNEIETLMSLMYNKCHVRGQRSRPLGAVRNKTDIPEPCFHRFGRDKLGEKKRERDISDLFTVNCQLEDLEENVCGILSDLVMGNI